MSIQPIDLEDYTASALNGEAAILSSPAALDALAIAIRTYARANPGRHGAAGYDFCDNTHCQRLLRGRPPERVAAAVERTRGEILWARGRAADVYFHRNCGGRTEDAGAVWPGAARSWLPVQTDDACLHVSPREWRSEIPLDSLARALGLREFHTVRVATRTPSGRAATLRSESGFIDAERLHLAVGRGLGWGLLKSRLYDVHVQGDAAVFEGRGSGHGVGLCQEGAEARGRAGQSAEQILAFYFPGTRVGVAARGFAWKELRGERVTLRSETPHAPLLEAAERALRRAEQLTGIGAQPGIRVVAYPSLDAYRDATGEPGFVAASTRGRTVSLQPEATLRVRGGVDATLRHEMIHVLLAQRTRVQPPRWFGEGLALALSGEPFPDVPWTARSERMMDAPRNAQELRDGYAACAARVRRLWRDYGRERVLSWLETGLPREVR